MSRTIVSGGREWSRIRTRALAWIKTRKFDPSDKYWNRECLLLSIATMALVAVDAIYEAQRQREIVAEAAEEAQR